MSEITQDSNGFSKSFAITHAGEEFFLHLIQFQNKQILNISINGILDTTFKIPTSTKTSINYESMMDLAENDDEDEFSPGERGLPEPQMIIGDYSNMKISIVASQVGKLMSLNSPREIILSIGSKWFGKGDQVCDDDFEKLTFILENVKRLL
ncbi:Irc25 protein [Candida orthopsilosis Co 90-125]|uniref:Irc25 protein n=1 Tax=Candida orthopsilosis (strain 90-125) TaxID=1136231 RepID=H8X9W1_CANO9|nr:Irc25 protein [Candida orthopsilosis Co 90-125]CCG24778.1 Irc25 protein [Candida orthopsilosis Co 90-125]